MIFVAYEWWQIILVNTAKSKSIVKRKSIRIISVRTHRFFHLPRNPLPPDVHSTTLSRHSPSIGTILLITLEESCYIDLTLQDIYKQEFYTKMNLVGEIIFEDHRGALITGYLPNEILSQSIFNFVYHEDRLVKLHALWKCKNRKEKIEAETNTFVII